MDIYMYNMYIYIYECIYTYYIHVCIYTHIYIHICMHTACRSDTVCSSGRSAAPTYSAQSPSRPTYAEPTRRTYRAARRSGTTAPPPRRRARCPRRSRSSSRGWSSRARSATSPPSCTTAPVKSAPTRARARVCVCVCVCVWVCVCVRLCVRHMCRERMHAELGQYRLLDIARHTAANARIGLSGNGPK
jgi:hypothetical protein